MRKYESGFGVVGILISIVVVAGLVAGGWYVWQRNQAAPPAPQTIAPQEATPAKQTLVIAEWNIGAKNNSDYTLVYKISADRRYAYFTANELTTATGSVTCGIDVVNGAQMSGGGRIARYLTGEKTGEYPTLTAQELVARFAADPVLKDNYTQVGPYHYFYFGPQGPCSGKELDMQQKVNTVVNALIPTLDSVN